MPKPFKLKLGEPLTDAQRLMPTVRAAEALSTFINGIRDFKDDEGNYVFERYGSNDEEQKSALPDDVKYAYDSRLFK